MKITAETNKVFSRIHDNFIVGSEITLGYDFSTGVKREDLPEYYEQVDEPDEDINDTEALTIILGKR